MEPATTNTPLSTPTLEKLYSPTPIKTNKDSDHISEQEKNQTTSPPPLHVLPLAEALECALKNGLPPQKRILYPSSKRKSLLRTTTTTTTTTAAAKLRETAHATTEEAIQATMERIGPRHPRILNLIATRDPMDTITAEQFWNAKVAVEEEEKSGQPSSCFWETRSRHHHHPTTSPGRRMLQDDPVDTTVDEEEDVATSTRLWKTPMNGGGYTSATTPCTVQVDFDNIPQANEENDDLSFSYDMSSPQNEDEHMYVQHPPPSPPPMHDQQRHPYKIQHVAGMTVGLDSNENSSQPCKRPKTTKNVQNFGRRNAENRQPRELRFLPASREGDGLREVGSGLRRSQRTRFPVLKFWKNETILYERRDSRQFPTIAGILAYPDTPQEEMEELRKKRRRRGKAHSRNTRNSDGTETCSEEESS
jgi:hypothetical protein